MASTSIREVARHAGVSVGTVSNVLNRPELVAEETRHRVHEAIERTGYVRNEAARHLRAGRSRTIGMVVLDVANPFFTDVARGVEAVADEMGSVVTVCNSGDSVGRENRHLDVLLEQRVQGLLITPIQASNGRLLRFLEWDIPVVLVDRGAGRHRLCSVAVNDFVGGHMAAAHLLESGRDRLGFVGGPASLPQVANRRAGAREAVTEAGGDANAMWALETPALTVRDGRAAGAEVAGMAPDKRPTGVFCANDLLALGVLQELMRRGLRVPDDVALVGYDDIEYAEAALVPLTSVRQPRDELGRTAASMLFEEINQPHGHRHRQLTFEPELVVRDSSFPSGG